MALIYLSDNFKKVLEMKKIIILSDTGDARSDLISFLKELFPECEIQILSYRSKSVEEGLVTALTGFKKK